MSSANVELARRGFDAAARGDYEVVRELLDPEVKWHGGDPTAPGSCHNREQALAFRRDVPVFAELVDVVDAGRRVVVIIRPAGETEPHANVATFRAGKVVEMVHYEDVGESLAAAGVETP